MHISLSQYSLGNSHLSKIVLGIGDGLSGCQQGPRRMEDTKCSLDRTVSGYNTSCGNTNREPYLITCIA